MAVLRYDHFRLEESAAFHYGLCAFEGILCWKQSATSRMHLFRLKEHLERMKRSMAFLGLNAKAEDLRSAVLEAASSLCGCAYVRPVAYATAPFTETRLKRHNLKIEVFSQTFNGKQFLQGMRKARKAVILDEPRLSWGTRLANVKVSGKYVLHLSAREEARRVGKDEALLMDRSGRLVEASIANLLLVREKTLVVPTSPERFPGITMDSLLAIAEHKGIPVSHEEVDPGHLDIFDDAFVCGTASGVVPLASISSGRKRYRFTCSLVQDILGGAYIEILDGTTERFREWLTPPSGM